MKDAADNGGALIEVQGLSKHFPVTRGLIFQRKKKYSAALESFREALKINTVMNTIKGAVKEIERLEQGI